jgi:FAD/FMN-containing dehydrogenase
MPILHADDLTGRLIRPDDAAYDSARAVFYGDLDARPAVIARPADADDVARVVRAAAGARAELAIRAGGHSLAGYSTTDGGILLDLRDLKSIEVDAAGGTAWAGAGLTAGEYTTAVGEHGLATGFGDTGSVGIGGITLGGGVGLLSRRHGLTVDSLVAAEIVTADGRLRRVDQEHDPDLFWAIRGGGGNFGVVTRFGFRLHQVDRVTGGFLVLPATADAVAAFLAEVLAAPDELTVIANVMPAPPLPFLPAELHGRLVLGAILVHSGPPEDGERVLARLRGVAPPLADTVQVTRYPELFPPQPGDYRPTVTGRTMFVDAVDHAAISTIVDMLAASDAAMRVTQFRVLGGAVTRMPDDATAYAHRARSIMVNLGTSYDGPADRAARETWLDTLAAAVDPIPGAAYVNFLGPGSDARDAYPGPTWDRLVAVKDRYDPENQFRVNLNIPPSR